MKSSLFCFDWTLKTPFHLEGIGLHSGQPARIQVLPHHEPGLFFKHQGSLIPILASHIASTHYCTTLQAGNLRAQTIEHLLAALWGSGISAACLQLEGPECPILDGSARPWQAALLQAGIQVLPSRRRFYRPTGPGQVGDAQSWIRWEPADWLELDYCIDYPGPPPLRLQRTFIYSPEGFAQELAAARTFVYRQAVETLWQSGLALGGSRENALVIEDQIPAPDWRFEDEPIRHKLLDLIGDLALLGAFPLARIQALRSGHRHHVTMVASWLKSNIDGKHRPIEYYRDPETAAPPLSFFTVGSGPRMRRRTTGGGSQECQL